jgi:hypothetical protein
MGRDRNPFKGKVAERFNMGRDRNPFKGKVAERFGIIHHQLLVSPFVIEAHAHVLIVSNVYLLAFALV